MYDEIVMAAAVDALFFPSSKGAKPANVVSIII